jgi:hypothetical protein
VGIVVLGGAGIATVPMDGLVGVVCQALDPMSGPAMTDVQRLSIRIRV